MGKLKLNLDNISPSLSQLGSYTIVLSVDKSNKRIPIIINAADASYINAFVHNGYKNTNGYTKIIKNTIIALGGSFEYVEIESITEGVFGVFLVISNVHGEIKIKTSIAEALSFSILTQHGLIFASESVVDKVALKMDNSGHISEADKRENHRDRGAFKSKEDLEEDLAKAILEEDFETAAKLRDRINNVG